MSVERRALRVRFERLMERRGVNECWPWRGSIGSHGYGQINSGGRAGVPLLAHRVAYELFVGPIPARMHVDHVAERGCTLKSCVNPAHLEPVTQQENNRRQRESGLVNVAPARVVSAANRAAKTHCKHGHPYSPENTGRRPNGYRYCRACRRERSWR